MNENPFSNQEIHALFEHGFELEYSLKEPCIICMALYIRKRVANQTVHFADAFAHKNVVYGYDVVTT